MEFTLAPLPYAKDALAPYISARTLDFHYDRHHRGYVEKLSKLLEGKDEAKHSLEEILRKAEGTVFNNAAQVWNHDFYWRSMRPPNGKAPGGDLAEAINRDFGSLASLKQQLAEAANNEFGSGWAWLVSDSSRRLKVLSTDDAVNPLILPGQHPLLTIDVWEHAYYLDYQHERAKYVQGLIEHLFNWEFAAANYARLR